MEKEIRKDTFDNILAWIEASKGSSVMADLSRSSRTINYSQTNWHDSLTYEEAIQYALKGWPLGATKVNEYLMHITPYLQTIKGFKIAWNPGRLPGGSIIMDRYAKGIPDFMLNRCKMPSHKFARVMFNSSIHADADPDQYFKRGAVIIALINTLERSNYRVEVLSQNSTLGSGGHLITETIIKHFGESLDLDRLAFWACSRAINRRISFSYRETLDLKWRQWLNVGGGYGSSIDYPPSDPKTIYFPTLHGLGVRFTDTESMINYLKELLLKMGVQTC